jgi:hypothetical protein
MPQTITIASRSTARDWKLLTLYTIAWTIHFVVAVVILTGKWLSADSERPLAVAWCVLVVIVIPLVLLAMNRTQRIEIAEESVTISGSGIPLWPVRHVSRSTRFELNLMSPSPCWGAYDILFLKWGRLPWQCVYLAPLACTDEKMAIGRTVAGFLTDNHIDVISSLATSESKREQAVPPKA